MSKGRVQRETENFKGEESYVRINDGQRLKLDFFVINRIVLCKIVVCTLNLNVLL